MGFKKKDKFAIQLSNIASNIKESAQYFDEYKLTNVNDLKVFTDKLKEFETKGDTYVHEVIKDLNNTFITPIEREDILALAMSMDDVLDGIEHTGALFELYSIINVDDYMRQFVDAIVQCTIEIELAIELLSTKRLQPIAEHSIKIKDFESKCDNVLRQALKNLFHVEKDPIRIIQLKEIYEELEQIADYCQKVANTLDSIIMKNA